MTSQPEIVIVGAGFGGLAAAKALANEPVNVTVLDRANHHLFQPLLYQVATAALSPAQIAQPIRHVLKEAANVRVAMEDVVRIDTVNKQVVTTERSYPYDKLVLATGARHSYFGRPEWEQFAPGLKSLEDAVELRRRLLNAFETAEKTDDIKERDAALTFVIVGGGPTGVEMAGSISEVARKTMVKDFRRIDSSQARVILIDAAPRVLPMFHESLSASAKKQLESIGVEVRVGVGVKGVSAEGVELEGEFIPAKTIVWAAGNAASPLGKQLGAELDRAGRVMVEPDCSVKGNPDIYVIGDLACFAHQGDRPLPGVSPVALQMGKYVGETILDRHLGHKVKDFEYLDKGSMATIGRNRAIADIRGLRFDGFTAWLAWLFVHLIFLVGFRNRMLVIMQWAWGYFAFYRGARLITGGKHAEPQAPAVVPAPASNEPVAKSA